MKKTKHKITPEQGQKEIDDIIASLPEEIDKIYQQLKEKIKMFQTFDLLSNISHYNHSHSSDKYSDYRGDKNFIIPEILALLCLKDNFVQETTISLHDYFEAWSEIQSLLSSYVAKKQLHSLVENQQPSNFVTDITKTISIEAASIRNLGLPDHHFIFTERIFTPIQNEIKSIFGFSISDTVTIRKSMLNLISHKYNTGLDLVDKKVEEYYSEIVRYKKTKLTNEKGVFTKEQLDEYSLINNRLLKKGIKNQLYNEFHFQLGNIYTFTATELSEYTKVDIYAVYAFLNLFSCEFPALTTEDEIYAPITILKTKPIIKYGDRYLVPSFTLFPWSVEEVIEEEIKKHHKLQNKYIKIRHDFLLNQGLKYFSTLLPTSTVYPANLYYNMNGKSCETDALIIYDKTLFIIEAKAIRITNKAKQGHELKTDDHLKDIVLNSYTQCSRTLQYINESEISEFRTKYGEKFSIKKDDLDDIIMVTLTIEPLSNISMSIKATNEIGYFKEGIFPWIISIYDLVIIADLFENPILFIHYLKKRQEFLSHEKFQVHDELDLVAYYLQDGLNVENGLKLMEDNNMGSLIYGNATDEINDFYWYKFGHKTKYTPKPKSHILDKFNDFLIQLDYSKIEHRLEVALSLLKFNDTCIEQIMTGISDVKTAFSKDENQHDRSFFTIENGGLGLTFMTATDQQELDFKLYNYCCFKSEQLNASTWIGLGDVSTNPANYDFQCLFFATI